MSNNRFLSSYFWKKKKTKTRLDLWNWENRRFPVWWPVFQFTSRFNSTAIFTVSRTRNRPGSRFNRLNRPVRSGFDFLSHIWLLPSLHLSYILRSQILLVQFSSPQHVFSLHILFCMLHFFLVIRGGT